MQLTTIQRDILNMIRLNADQELSVLARRLNVTEKTVRYNFESLQRRGLISRANFFDLYPLGLRNVNMYFSVIPTSSNQVRELLNAFLRVKELTFLSELGGDFHYGAAFALHQIEQLPIILSTIPSELQSIIFDKAYTVHTKLTMYPLKTLGSPADTELVLGYGHSENRLELDELSTKLLHLLNDRPELSIRELAKALKSAPSTIVDRVTRLREMNILKGSWLRVNFEALGYSAYKLIISTRGLSLNLDNELNHFARQSQNVDYVIQCIGGWDYEIGLIVQSPVEVTSTIRDLETIFIGKIRPIKVLPFFRMLHLRQVPLSVVH